jgi:hypothetical protein
MDGCTFSTISSSRTSNSCVPEAARAVAAKLRMTSIFPFIFIIPDIIVVVIVFVDGSSRGLD